ncbi:hypothetical protein GCM10023084_71930 [Streptomyces lacrimifluminis]|uniref:Uncharacterized protein n=1 Tax=Streptomyces lacrimifluminis TaxID=1500077 RepID=A0A917UJU9_9ACTN|nr:hypothetical protein GCM10012282_70010 [Streptomyces lacrimifluminis]
MHQPITGPAVERLSEPTEPNTAGPERVLTNTGLDQLVETTAKELPDHESVTVSSEPVVVLGR